MHASGSATIPGAMEQRAHPRLEVPLRCWLDDGDVPRFASMRDVSMQGARVQTACPPEAGSFVIVRFKLGESSPEVEARARVVWSSAGFRGRAGVLGLSFHDLAGEDELRAFVAAGVGQLQ